MSSSLRPRTRGLRFDAGLSLGLHLLIWGVLLAALAPRAVPFLAELVHHQSKAAQAKKENLPDKLRTAGQDTMPPSKESIAASAVEGQMAQSLSGELMQRDQAALLDHVHQSLAQDVEKMQEAGKDEGEISVDLQKDAYAATADELKDLGHDALKDEIDAQLKGGVAEQVKNAIEQGVSTQMSQAIGDKLRERLQQERQARIDKQVANVEAVKKQLSDARDVDTQAAQLAAQNQLAPATDAAKKGADAATNGDKAADGALADTVKNFPQLATQADQAGKAIANDAQQNMQAATQSLAAKNKDAAAGQLNNTAGSLNNQITALNQLQDQVRQTASNPDADPMSQQLLAQDLAALKAAVAEQLRGQSLDAMSSTIADRLAQALAAQAASLNISAADLRKLIESEIKSQLAAEFKDHPPVTDGALNSARLGEHLLTTDEVDHARQATDDAVKALQTARQSEASLPVTDMAKTTDDLANQQVQATTQYGQAHDAMEKARDAARAIGVADQNKVFQIGESDRLAEDAAKLKVIPDLLHADQRPGAEQMRTQVVQSLDERIGQMRDLSASLSQQQAALAAQQKAFAGPVKVDPQVAAAVQRDMEEDVTKISGAQLPGLIAAAGNIQASDGRATDLRMDGIASLLGKVGQLQSNMAEGRPGGGLGGGLGFGPGNGLPARGNLFGSRFAALNMAGMEKYGAYLRDRTNPDNFYKTPKEPDGFASVAEAVAPSDLPALVYFGPENTPVPAAPTAPPAPGAPAPPERQVPEPSFKTVAFGAAAMMDKPITIDGDLSDWGELQHPLPTRFHGDGSPVTDPTNVYVRWSPDGLYIGYMTKKQGPIVADAWAGDCLEVWIDGQNVRRKQMSESPTSQQIFLAPFGCQGNPAPAIVEVGRGARGLKMFTDYIDRTGVLGKVAARMVPGGYTVEAFLSRKAIAYPNLVPGAYLAFNFSVNHDGNMATGEQWSTPKAQLTWDKPDTWGDLLLLGSDAKVHFVAFDDPSKPAQPLVPGQPIAFEVDDKDMDLNPHEKDRVPAILRIKGEDDGLFIILEETTPNSGVFLGSVNTQPYEAPAKANTLNIRGGEAIELVYSDLRSEYGEKDRVVTADLPVGTPVLRLADHP